MNAVETIEAALDWYDHEQYAAQVAAARAWLAAQPQQVVPITHGYVRISQDAYTTLVLQPGGRTIVVDSKGGTAASCELLSHIWVGKVTP